MQATTTINPIKPLPRRLLLTLRRQPPAFLIATAILVLLVFVALTGPWWAPYDHIERAGDSRAPLSTQHLLGTDHLGRDVFSRVILGARVVLIPALLATGLGVIGGSALGIILVLKRGWVDEIGMRGVDTILSIPPLILTLLILSVLGPSKPVVILTIAFFYTFRTALTIRAAAQHVVTEDFVTKARLRGESTWSIAAREVFPNVTPIVFVEVSLRTGQAVLIVAALSFLGFGNAPPTPDWGLMIAEGRRFITAAPWVTLGPALTLASLVVAMSLFTEGISEILGLSAQREPTV